MSGIETRSISPSVRCVIREDGAVLLDIESGLMYSVNGVGGLIWEKLSQGIDLEEIAVSLAAQFGIAIEESRQDVQTFVNDLIHNRLLV